MDHTECIDKAILNPEGRFRHLMDVIAAVDVTAREKLANLKAWEADERAPQRAESEGMGGGEHSHLHRVREALARIEAELPAHCLNPHDKSH